MASWKSAWQALLIVAMVISGIAWFSRLMAISRKKQANPLGGDDFLRGLLEGCDVFASGLFVLLTVVSLYWFIFFKLQSDVYTMARPRHHTAPLCTAPSFSPSDFSQPDTQLEVLVVPKSES